MLIDSVHIEGFWNIYSLYWKLNRDVNILSGINGSGKTTLIHSITSVLYFGTIISTVQNKIKFIDIQLTEGYRICCINKKDGIQTYCTHNEHEISFEELQRKIHVKDVGEIENTFSEEKGNERFNLNFYPGKAYYTAQINEFFASTHKKWDETSEEVRFLLEGNKTISFQELSSGEKRLLLLLFSIRMQKQEEIITFWDEPELSMHIDWQRSLIRIARTINPSAQLIIATHSPSIIYEGWEKRVVNMEDLLRR